MFTYCRGCESERWRFSGYLVHMSPRAMTLWYHALAGMKPYRLTGHLMMEGCDDSTPSGKMAAVEVGGDQQ